MASNITSSPGYLILPAGQQLIYTFGTSLSPIPSDFRFVVQVYEFGTSEIGKYYLTPNINGVAHFDLSKVITSRHERDTTDNAGNPLWKFGLGGLRCAKGVDNSKGYQIRVGSFTSSVETLNEDNENIVLIDAYRQKRLGLHPSFAQYYAAAATGGVFPTCWMSDVPLSGTNTLTTYASDDDTGVLAFLYNDLIGDTIKYVRTIIESDTTTTSYTYTDISTAGLSATSADPLIAGNSLGYFAAYPKNIAQTMTLPADWHTIKHELNTAAFGQRSKQFVIKRTCYPASHISSRMAFSNSLGGWDFITWDGRRKRTQNRTAKTYSPITGTWNATTFSNPADSPDVIPFHVEMKESYQLRKFMSTDEFPLLDSLSKARQIYLELDGQYLPVTMSTNRVDIREETMSKMAEVTIEVELAQNIEC